MNYRITFYTLILLIIVIILLIRKKNDVDICLIYSEPKSQKRISTSTDLIVHLEKDFTDWQLLTSQPVYNFCTLEPGVLAIKAKLHRNPLNPNEINQIEFKISPHGLTRKIGILNITQSHPKDWRNKCDININLLYNSPKTEDTVNCTIATLIPNDTFHVNVNINSFSFQPFAFTPKVRMAIPPKICNAMIIDR